ncbi:MAG: DUF4446 family protein [Patescibacteria group bacterium]
MFVILYLLTTLNFFALLYLAYLILIKYRSKSADINTKLPVGTIEKVGLLRFNPFEDLGSDQSFILSLLDHSHSGVIITSLHHRNFTRIYAKPIKNGEGDKITLSKEEKSAILNTINR